MVIHCLVLRMLERQEWLRSFYAEDDKSGISHSLSCVTGSAAMMMNSSMQSYSLAYPSMRPATSGKPYSIQIRFPVLTLEYGACLCLVLPTPYLILTLPLQCLDAWLPVLILCRLACRMPRLPPPLLGTRKASCHTKTHECRGRTQ